jgi:hypothetical protein
MLLHLVFRNLDGSPSPAAIWALATSTVVWCAWGMVALVRPQLLQQFIAAGFGGRVPVTVFRVAAIPVFVVGAAVAVFVLTATPGRSY